MSINNPNPGGKARPRLVAFCRLSADHSFTYQCAETCTFACVGDDNCHGIKFPVMGAGMVPGMLPASSANIPSSGLSSGLSSSTSIPSSSSNSRPTVVHASTSVAVVPPQVPPAPTLEINTLLARNTAPLDPSSPTTKQYMTGIIITCVALFIYI